MAPRRQNHQPTLGLMPPKLQAASVAPLNKQTFLKQAAFDLYALHIACMREEEGAFQAKHHLLFHLLAKSEWCGNPTLYATWLSEAYNKKMKAATRNTSQATFERSLLLRMRTLLKSPGVPQKRRAN